MVHTCVDTVLEDLEYLEKGLFFDRGDLVEKLKVELRFLRTFLWCSSGWRNCSDGGYLRSHLMNIESVLRKAGEDLSFARDRAISGSLNEKLDHVVDDLLEKVEAFKVEIGEDFIDWAKHSLEPNNAMSGEVLVEFFDCVLVNLKDLLKFEGNLILSLKEQISALEVKLRFLRNFVIFTNRQCSGYENIGLFFTSIEDAANKVAAITYLCCLQRTAESKGEVNEMLSDLLVKIKPSTSDIIEMFVGILKASKISRSDIYVVGEVVVNFVNFLLEILRPANDQVEQLREGLILIMAFLIDPPENYKWEGKQISSQTEAVVSQVASLCSFYADKTEGQIPVEKDQLLADMIEKIAGIKTKVGEIFPEVSGPPSSFFPRVDKLGIVDSFLRNLMGLLESRANSIVFLKHQFEKLLSDLEFLRAFLVDTAKQQNELEDLVYMWSYIAGVTNEVEFVIDSFLVGDYPVWYYKLRVSVAVDVIELIKSKVRAFCDHHNHNLYLQKSMSSDPVLSEVNSPKIDGTLVGFLDEAETIRVKLTRGGMQLDIVAIVGMAGLGKTTLAKRLYHEPSVARHFHVRAWCCISQVYEKRDLLLTILNQIIELTDQIRGMKTEDLDEVLYKSLKKERFFIVMDDMWSTGAWDDLKRSFPDDRNGSRIMFTTRHREVALEAKSDCDPHALRFFSDGESWELLEKRVFQQQKCPEELVELGRQIATACKGLPLSIVLVAGILARTQKRKDWWMQVVDSLSSKLVGEMEQCKDILGLSFKHLPDHLKPCFLYFGALPQGEEIAIRKLIRLWAAEGLVCNNDVAEYYLMDLVNRSLVIVSKRRSKDHGVKTCHVHDLLHDYCVARAKEECFLMHIFDDDVREPDLSDLICQFEGHMAPDIVEYDVRRLSVFSTWERFRNRMPCGPRVRSLMFFSANVTSQFKYQSSFSSHISRIFNNFKHLKVLDLGRINVGDSFPGQVEKLVLLRYLALRGRIKSIPSSIANLWNLETLIVKGLKGEVTLPDTILEMASLRHLHINNRVVFSLDDSEPGDTSQSNLETCSTLSLSHGICAEMIIRRLVNIRKLKSIFFESWNDLANCNRFPVLHCLSRLESLKLLYHGSIMFPCEMSLPLSLRKLTLSKFRLPWDEMSTILKLPNLEVLKLLHRAFEGEQWNMGDAEFLKLKFLKLDTLKLVQWNASSDNFPCLEQLVLQKCKQLEEIPSSFGDIATLEKIEVQWCSISASKSATDIEAEEPDIKVLIHPPLVESSSE
ncbi:putative late blight resistance protein homolog R1A-3 [Coffea arabica]|uniref:Late blight resistance protein homolog R1A-3 n=1 Tax=Coffea arabica TaxID=13443 RepID=A0ABM4WF90_COFAR